MISLAKKILVNGRTTAAQPLGGDAEVRKYSLTSAHEPPSPISGTSFALNPEHVYATTYRFNWSGRTNGNSQEDTILKMDGVASNPDMVDGVVDTTAMTVWPGASNPDILERSNHVEVMFKQPSRATVCTSEGQPEDKDLGYGSGVNRSNENLTHVIATASISPSETDHQSLLEESDDSQFRVRSSDREQHISSDEKISESQMQNKTSRGNSLCLITDDGLDSGTNVFDVPAISTSSLNVLETSTRFQQARRKQRSRELKPRRKTLEIFYFGSKSSDALASKSSWSQSKSLMPSPMNLEPSCVDLRRRRSASRSRVRRHTLDGLGSGSDVVASPEEQILGDPPSFWNVLWPAVYSSSDEVVSDVSKVDHRGKVVPAERTRGALGFKKGSLCATVICVSDMMRCQVIADLDLLEEDTEFEPCAVPFDNTAVLWPAAVDKPSCFESSRCFRSWISSLEAAGFIGSECLLMAPVTLSQGLHEHTQLLFLFPRHLLFTEQKSHSMLKLDQKVAAGDIWLSTRKEDMVEILDVDSTWDGSRSFVLGWPPMNTVFTFCTSEEKALWVAKIEELIEAEKARDKDPNQQLVIKILQKERGHTRTRELTVARSENASEVLQRCLLEFHLGASSSKDFQLFVRMGKDQALQPLLGHESPFLIETWFKNFTTRKDGSHGNCFVLRERKRSKLASRDAVGWIRSPKAPLRTLFKRSQSRTAKSVPLFGSSLSEICADSSIPGRIQALFRYLYEHGPSTDGIFRKPAGHKEVSDFKLHLNSVDEVSFENVSVYVVASVVKEWLRNLPDCILSCDLYLQWIDVSKISEVALVHDELRRLLSSLPASHVLVLRHLMCVLHRIQLHSKQNRMTPFNLAVCIGPNILHPHPSASIDLQLTSVEIANAVVRMLIEAIEPVLGSDCIELYQDVADPHLIQEFDVEGSYEFCQTTSMDSTFTQNSTNLPTTDSLESLDSLHENPPIVELDQLLESMSPDSGLAASDPQLYEEDPPMSEMQSKGHYLKRIHQRHELHWKSEPSDVSESQTPLDSDTESQSSQASDGSASTPGRLQMHGGRNVRECLQQFQISKLDSEEPVSSFEDQISFSDDRSDSVVSTLEASGEVEKPASAVEAKKSETRSLCDKADGFLAAHEESEKIKKGEKNDLNSNTAPEIATETSEQNFAKVGFTVKDKATNKPPEAPAKKLAASQFHLTSIEIVSPQMISTEGDTSLQTVGSIEARPTKQGKTSSSVVRTWVKKMEERQSENIPQRKQNHITFSMNQQAIVEFENDNPDRHIITSPTPEAIARITGKDKLCIMGKDKLCTTGKDKLCITGKDKLEDLPKDLSKVKQSRNTLRTPAEPEPRRAPLEIYEQRLTTLNLSEEDRSRNKTFVVSQRNCSKEMVPKVFRVTESGETDSREPGKCSQQTESYELKIESKQFDHPVSRKANHETDSRKFNKQIDSSESGNVSKQNDAPDSRKANRHINQPESTCFVSMKSSPESIVVNSELQDDKKLRARRSGHQEKHAGPLQLNELTDPCVKSIKIAMDENTIVTRSNDQRKEARSRIGCGKVGLNHQLRETEWRDRERRLKDQPSDSRVRDSRLKVQLRDSDDKWRLEHGETEWKDSSLEEHRLKDQPRVSRLKYQSRDSRLADQPKKSRQRVQLRASDDNWRIERDSENFEQITSARVITSAYPRNITSQGCRATMGTLTGHSRRYLPQSREPLQNGQPMCTVDRFGAQRSVTVIQLCNDNSVIMQKTVKMT